MLFMVWSVGSLAQNLQLEISPVSIFRPTEKTIFKDQLTLPLTLSYTSYGKKNNHIYLKGSLHYYYTKGYLKDYTTSKNQFLGMQAQAGYEWHLGKWHPSLGLSFAMGWSFTNAENTQLLLYKDISTFNTHVLVNTDWLYQIAPAYKLGLGACISHKSVAGTTLIFNYAL